MLLRSTILAVVIAAPSCLCKGPSSNHNKSELHIAMPARYLPTDLKDQFERETGITIVLAELESVDERKRSSDLIPTPIDMMIVPDHSVEKLKEMDRIVRIDTTKLAGEEALLSEYPLNLTDVASTFQVPMAWTTIGIATDSRTLPTQFVFWRDFLDQEFAAGGMSLLDNAVEALSVALFAQRKHFSSLTPSDVSAAGDAILKIRPKIREFTSNPAEGMTKGLLRLTQMHSADALQLRQSLDGAINFSVPMEGSLIVVHEMVIANGVRNTEGVYKFMEFMLRAGSQRSLAEFAWLGPVIKGVEEQLAPQFRNNETLFPSLEVKNRLEYASTPNNFDNNAASSRNQDRSYIDWQATWARTKL